MRIQHFLLGACLSLGFFLKSTVAHATHLRAGEITVERINCSRTFRITITVYTNTIGTPVIFGGGTLDFGDGSPVHVTAQDPGIPRPDLGEGVSIVVYSDSRMLHTYPGNGRYVISYSERNRNEGVLNMLRSVETEFYIETVINIDPFLGCSSSPQLLVPPIDRGCTGAAWFHNPGAFDRDGDSLSYELTIPKQDRNLDVNAYRDPNNIAFYAAIGRPFNQANEEGNGPPTFSINSQTGTITWDAPGAAGQYNIAFLIKEWRKIGRVWVNIGYVTRDMQILIEDCDNQRPELMVKDFICVEAGTRIEELVVGTDPDGDNVKIEAFSQVFGLLPARATFPPPQFTAQPLTQEFTWDTQCSDVKDQPYQVVFKITDDPDTGPRLVSFKTLQIRVIGPAPQWISATVNLANRSAVLDWQNYACPNATLMQVWRRVDSFGYTREECVTGIPEFLGYTKIADVPIGISAFTDSNGGQGLANGAQYCYRLVAIFPQPGGGESYVSDEICIPPIRADVPIITHVTVDETSVPAGRMTVRWTPPFEADPGQFPPPYTYEVQRAEGFNGNVRLTTVATGIIDTFFVDTNFDTETVPHNYRVTARSGALTVGTSVTASSVFLETAPQFQRIRLTWSADVPWSINTQPYEKHIIYRGPENATNAEMIPIDTVNVNTDGFVYIDSGQYNNIALEQSQVYCYRVLTQGAYGNPLINEPLLNFSQRSCAQPDDDQDPCPVALEPAGTDCNQFLASASCDTGSNTYQNSINWRRPADADCREDIRSYKVYFSPRAGSDFTLLVENVRDTFFVHRGLTSFAGCYRVSTVDRAGNESELSEPLCFDNCPNYHLPNVFTPNGDGCNDVFSAYSTRGVGEAGVTNCGTVDLQEFTLKCARFVVRVDFFVYNRWGKEVYTYRSGGENSIFIDWNGRDNQGNELTTGVYYYQANLTFDVVDPSRQTRSYKGWVHVKR
ncbi:MAG: gliding motility-associated C-terminal domain-containing protein [Cyclobacteriaceae bacterium]|jgi:hypothetical protein|nr:gliding motility-associated C-terminal domain-containing protein [Cyclobacteriaceae bacterium]